MRFTLQARYSAVIVSLVAVIVLCMSVISLIQFRSSAEAYRELSVDSMEQELIDQISRRGEVIATLLANNLVMPLYKYDMPAMRELTQATADLPDIIYAYVYDEAGRIVHDGTREIAVFGELLDERVDSRVTEHREPRRERVDTHIQFTWPISLNGEHLGGVHLAVSLAGISEDIGDTETGLAAIGASYLARNVLIVAVATAVLLIVGILLAVLVSRSLVRPIRALAEHAQRIGRGDYTRDIEVHRGDEIGDLATAFREMSRNLALTAEEVHFLAYHDSLTKLPNRAMQKRLLGQAVARARRTQSRAALLFIDLDDFKRVNDTLGHEVGDQLLKQCADRLCHCVRQEDFAAREADGSETSAVARLGGDEFTVILEGIRDSMNAAAVAERILEALTEPFRLSGQEVVVGASIGVTVFPDDGADVAVLLKNADIAMYHAKEEGKNAFQFYNDGLNEMAVDRLSLETDLRHALEQNQLHVVYQPLLHSHTDAVMGVEALLRWHHPERGMISPELCVALAERTGLIADIGEWVLRTTCRDLRKWRDAGLPEVFAAVNLSSVQFRRQNVPEVVGQALWESGLPARQLRLEITETGIMRNTIKAAEMLAAVKEMGVQVWVDDFGTGFSSINYLRRFPIDGVKIDSSFVADIGGANDDRRIISAIISMAHQLEMIVTAEGVEESHQLEFLRREGCDLVQGRLFAAPLGADDLADYLRSQHATERVRVLEVVALQTGTYKTI